MRKFHVAVEGTDFELEVEEYKQVPLITAAGSGGAWKESGHREIMSACPDRKRA